MTKEHKFIGHSDCEIVPHLFDETDDFAAISNALQGKFGSLIYDEANERIIVTRDHLGIIPVYIGRGAHGEFFVASELKAFHDYATSVEILLPGNKIYINIPKATTMTPNTRSKLNGTTLSITT